MEFLYGFLPFIRDFPQQHTRQYEATVVCEPDWYGIGLEYRIAPPKTIRRVGSGVYPPKTARTNTSVAPERRPD